MSECPIIGYDGGRDAEVAAFILTIQHVDVGLDMPLGEQPDLADIRGADREGGSTWSIAPNCQGVMPFRIATA